VLQWDGDHVVPDPEVGGGEVGEDAREAVERVEIGTGLPGRRDGRVEGVHERVHVGAGEVVLLVPRGRRQDNVGEECRRGHPEVEREQQVELALRSLAPPADLEWTLVRPGLGGPQRGVRAEKMPEEVLVALGAGSEQVRPPHGQDARPVPRSVGVLAGKPNLTRP
jgi:hypothetical protein